MAAQLDRASCILTDEDFSGEGRSRRDSAPTMTGSLRTIYAALMICSLRRGVDSRQWPTSVWAPRRGGPEGRTYRGQHTTNSPQPDPRLQLGRRIAATATKAIDLASAPELPAATDCSIRLEWALLAPQRFGAALTAGGGGLCVSGGGSRRRTGRGARAGCRRWKSARLVFWNGGASVWRLDGARHGFPPAVVCRTVAHGAWREPQPVSPGQLVLLCVTDQQQPSSEIFRGPILA